VSLRVREDVRVIDELVHTVEHRLREVLVVFMHDHELSSDLVIGQDSGSPSITREIFTRVARSRDIALSFGSNFSNSSSIICMSLGSLVSNKEPCSVFSND